MNYLDVHVRGFQDRVERSIHRLLFPEDDLFWAIWDMVSNAPEHEVQFLLADVFAQYERYEIYGLTMARVRNHD
jgi:hypothetical protein